MSKEEAIQYLIEHSVYSEEWTGAGMWVAVVTVMRVDDLSTLTKDYLDILLIQAENF